MWEENIWDEMNKMHRRIDKLFGKLGNSEDESMRTHLSDELMPNYRRAISDFSESNKEFVLRFEIPGVDKEDIKLDITDSGLEVRAEKKKEKKSEDKEKGDYRYSQSYSGFYQAVTLPEEADLDNIDADYKNGVLTVRVKKKEAQTKKKNIQIK